jgi:dTDP-4-amino-4,6-dideoxygalactose transaminase
MQAAVLQVKLRHLDGWIENRRAIARHYSELLMDLPVTLPAEAAGSRHVYYLYTMHAPRRDQLAAFLQARGIATQQIYHTPVPLQPCYAHLGYQTADLPVAARLAGELINLPMFPETRDDEVERVAAGIRSFYTGGKP